MDVMCWGRAMPHSDVKNPKIRASREEEEVEKEEEEEEGVEV